MASCGGSRNSLIVAAIACSILPVAMARAQAEDPAALDRLSHATESIDAGLALARDQGDRGELLGAMATLERLMINHPDAGQVQLLHASLMCRLDDRIGASVEFAALRRSDFKDRAWKDANAPCARDGGRAPGPSPGPAGATHER